MESRKRKSSTEVYVDGLVDPPEKQRKMNEFYNSLRQFYRKRWNAPLRLPRVQGVEVNLYRLYDTVMALGGWQKVASADKWSSIADMLGCKDDIVCGDHAIKLIYMRYLSKFEQVQTIGDVDDYIDNEMSRTRGRNATSFFATNECPISHSRLQEYIPRDERGNIINEPDYGRLTKSLLSGMPNEIDFAVNICMLLSHSGPRQLRICHAPTLLSLLVAHTGIYDENDQSLADMRESWMSTTSHDFKSFWIDADVPRDILEHFLGSDIEKADEDGVFFSTVVADKDVKDSRLWRVNQVATIIRNLTFEPINRVTIVRTWPVMKFLIICANCRWAALYTAAYDALSNLATDIDLTDRNFVQQSHHAVLRIIHEGVFSLDKFKLVRSLEMLTGLCAYEGNEATICDWLKPETLNHIFEIMGLKDIMMCVYVLECLYQISEMGDAACDMIADLPKTIQHLISMATMEAVSFGPAGLSGMKVVEYQPQYASAPPPQMASQTPGLPGRRQEPNSFARPQHPSIRTSHPVHSEESEDHPPPHPGNFAVPSGVPPSAQRQVHSYQMTVRQVIQCGLQNQHSQMQQQANLAIQQQQQQQQQQQHLQQQLQQQQQQHQQQNQHHQQQQPSSSVAHFSQNLIPKSSGFMGAPIDVQPIVPSTDPGECQVEQLTVNWIKQNCVFEPSISTPRGELYAAYVDDLRNQHHSLSGSLAMFSGVIKNLYPEVVFRMAENGVMIVAQGIRQIRPHRKIFEPSLAPATSSTSSPSTSGAVVEQKIEVSHPLMKKMLLEKDPVVNGVNGHANPPAIKTETGTDTGLNENETGKKKAIGKTISLTHTDSSDVGNDITNENERLIDKHGSKRFCGDTEKSEKGLNGKITNGYPKTSPSQDNRKKASVASRAASIVAAAQKLNGMNGAGPVTIQEVAPQVDTNDTKDIKPQDSDATTSASSLPSESVESVPRKPLVPTAPGKTDYMCDWDCCSLYYNAPAHVLKHLAEEHVVEELRLLCRWNGCSDPTPRNRWSLITHIQDMHCNESQLKNASVRRLAQGGVSVPRPIQRAQVAPRDISTHPGYAKNAAMDAIRRHAFNFMSRDLTDEPEGPVTKSIRLTSCLILRNLARYSSEGRQKLRRHESHLCWLALSRLESSFALTQLLSELNQIAITEDELKELPTVPSSDSLCSLSSSTNTSAPVSPTKMITPRLPQVQSKKPSFAGISHRALNFSTSSLTPSSEMPPPSLPRHHAIQQHIPTQPSPLIQTTPVRAGAGH